MLVLTRKKSEAIHIGEDIQVVVLSIEGNRVRIGITAPEHMTIIRKELLEDDGED